MTRIATCVSIAALVLLGGCVHERVNNAPNITAQQMPYQPGMGTGPAVANTPRPVLSGAGATAAAPASPSYRLTIRMDNGLVQYVDSDSQVAVGQRLELMPDRSFQLR